MPWPPATRAEKDAVIARQTKAAKYLRELATYAKAPNPPDPVTDAERVALRTRRDEAVAFLKTFAPKLRVRDQQP